MRRASIRNRYVLTAVLVAVAAGMVAGAYAEAPLSRLITRVTGHSSTPKVAEGPNGKVAARVMRAKFDASVKGMPWRFQPMAGSPTFTITPDEAAQHFNKVQCFCINQQALQPGETANLPVSFFTDPAIAEDHGLDHVTTSELSYTYYPVGEKEQENPGRVSRLTTNATTGKLD